MISSEELLGLVALSKLMDVREVIDSTVPVRLWMIGEIFSTEAAGIADCTVQALGGGSSRRVEDRLVARNRRA